MFRRMFRIFDFLVKKSLIVGQIQTRPPSGFNPYGQNPKSPKPEMPRTKPSNPDEAEIPNNKCLHPNIPIQMKLEIHFFCEHLFNLRMLPPKVSPRLCAVAFSHSGAVCDLRVLEMPIAFAYDCVSPIVSRFELCPGGRASNRAASCCPKSPRHFAQKALCWYRGRWYCC
jgi:hypothetical protein